MGEMRVIRKIYRSPDPNIHDDLMIIEYQEDCVVLKFVDHERIHITARAAHRLGIVLCENKDVSKILSEIQSH